MKDKKIPKVDRNAMVMLLDMILAVCEPLKKFREDLINGKFDER